MSSCAACGLPAHRYGRNEGMERYDPMACINQLRGKLEDLANGERVEWCDEHNAPQWRDDKCYTVVAIEARGSARFNTCRIVTRLVLIPPTKEEA